MEQGLSFIGVIVMCSIMLIWEEPVLFLIIFTIGSSYLAIRSKSKGWRWNR
jgi:hypothetical protein